MLKNKKNYILLITLFIIVVVSSCNSKNKLLLLNWGEYINEDLLVKFEEETGIEVVMSLADSNELFYSKIRSGTTVYDLVLPSDYMIEKMMEKNLLQEIDYSKLTNYNINSNPFMSGALGILNNMDKGSEKYAVPYFWGTFGLMYNKQKEGLEEAVKTNEWAAFFDNNKRPENTRLGMYDVPRYAFSASMFYNKLDPNNITEENLNIASKDFKNIKIDSWGTDGLKKAIAANNLDLAFLYTGDFLDTLYIDLDNGKKLEELTYDIHIPNDTIAFMDAFVIPKKSRNVDNAHKFIDFFLNYENAYENASVVGYATPLLNSYNEIVNYKGDDEWLNTWAYANKKYYPIIEGERTYQGIPLKNTSNDNIDKINRMINNVKTS